MNWRNGVDPVIVGVHRLSYMVKNEIVPSNMPEGDVSHICHNKRCVKYDHLALEPSYINKERESTADIRRRIAHERTSPIAY